LRLATVPVNADSSSQSIRCFCRSTNRPHLDSPILAMNAYLDLPGDGPRQEVLEDPNPLVRIAGGEGDAVSGRADADIAQRGHGEPESSRRASNGRHGPELADVFPLGSIGAGADEQKLSSVEGPSSGVHAVGSGYVAKLSRGASTCRDHEQS